MPSKLSTRLIALLAAVLIGGGAWYYWSGPAEVTTADATNPALVAAGQQAYMAKCASCHGGNLQGEPNWRSRRPDGTLPAPPHDESGHTWHHGDALLFGITKFGGQRDAPPGFVSRMPGFGESMSDHEIYAVLAYIKSRWPQQIRDRHERLNAQKR